ncbi:C40 family peptidase [Propionicimonas paludicola]|uniref:C40 family peptidase n=1 Tax=Propionicimonas paludicola TaxID=185243 RepID=UPI000BFA4BDD|nr:C40 family peptidase [Propionicimonas paludicola]
MLISTAVAAGTANAEPTPSPSPNPSASSKSLAAPRTAAEAKQRVKDLTEQASQIGEQYDEATDALADGKARLKSLKADIDAQQQKVDALTAEARTIALIQFRNRDLDPTVQVFTSGDPDSLLARLSTADKVDDNMESTLAEQQAQQASLDDMKRALDAEVQALADQEQKLADLKSQIDQSVQEAQDLYDRLDAQEQAALNAADGGSTTFDPGELAPGEASAKALTVIKYATSKVGSSQYVWGASGPNAFDCSGLMLASYRTVGVSLPHSSRAMSQMGRPVARGDLKPGDLIFWYNPVHHVGMYIGNGKIVHARNVRSDLVIQSLASYPAPWAGARRILG